MIDHLTETLTIIGLIGVAVGSMWLMPDSSKDIVVSVTSGLLGYLTKGILTK